MTPWNCAVLPTLPPPPANLLVPEAVSPSQQPAASAQCELPPTCAARPSVTHLLPPTPGCRASGRLANLTLRAVSGACVAHTRGRLTVQVSTVAGCHLFLLDVGRCLHQQRLARNLLPP
jgi:hypothetical protein